VDSHVYAQYVVTPYYDSMLAKLIVWGRNREEAITRTERALEEFIIEGVKTTIPFHNYMLKHPTFRSGQAHINLVETMMAQDRLQEEMAAIK
jgi:acetyl-CoA carboxylase biotin carboxylase subunit